MRRALQNSIHNIIEPLENRQLLSAGQLDSSFGAAGFANTGWAKDLGESIVLPSGKILVAGTVTNTYKDADGKDYISDSVAVARYNSNGTLDSTFGNGGVSPALNFPIDNSGSNADYSLFPRDMALQNDGKIVVALGVYSPYYTYTRLTRFNADGSIDTSFGGATRSGDSVRVPNSGYGGAQTLAIAPDNKIVVGTTANSDFTINRMNADGTVDTTFNRTGLKRIDFGGANPSGDALAGIAVQDDGKIVAAGLTTLGDGRNAFAAARLNVDGNYDTLFHGGHAYILDPQLQGHGATSGLFVPSEVSATMMLLPDERVEIMATSMSTGTALLRAARFTNRGSPDTTFGSGGIVGTDQAFEPRDAELQADGKIVLPGAYVTTTDGWTGHFVDPKIGMLRMDPNGSLDSTFKLDPALDRQPGRLNAISIQPDQKIIGTGIGGNSSTHTLDLFRLLNDGTQQPPPPPPPTGSAGSLDPSFRTGGMVDVNYYPAESLVLPNGKILVAATTSVPSNSSPPNIDAVMVTRFNSNGTPDTTFGTGGQSTKIINDNQDESLRALDLAVQSDGKIILAIGTNFTTRLARYNPDGTLDTTFGGSLNKNGSVPVSGAGFGGSQSLVITPDNKITVGTSTDGKFQALDGSFDFVISRLNADGTPDTSFGNGASFRRLDFGGATKSNDLLAGISLDNGKIIAAGVTTLSDGRSGYAAARLNADGSYDNLFNGGHAYILDPNLAPSLDWHHIPNMIFGGPAGDVDAIMSVTSDGRVEVAAMSRKDSTPDLRAARFTNRGSIDTSFGTSGIADTHQNFRPEDAEIQPDDKVLISGDHVSHIGFFGGYDDSTLDMLRLNTNGQLDSTFKMDSTLAGKPIATTGIALQPDQKIVSGAVTGTHDKLIRLLNGSTVQPPPPTTAQKPFKWPFGERELIQAEWFDYGGEGVAYHDDTPGNQSSAFRSGEDVDIADITGGQVVNRANQGEWLEYTIRSPFTTLRNFNLQARYATTRSGVVHHYYIDDHEAGSVVLAPTGSATTYQNSNTNIAILPGTHVLRVQIDAGGTDVGNFDWFRFVAM